MKKPTTTARVVVEFRFDVDGAKPVTPEQAERIVANALQTLYEGANGSILTGSFRSQAVTLTTYQRLAED